MYLEELASLSFNHSAKVTLVIDCGVASVAFKMPGNRTERVEAYRPTEHVNSVLQTLLERLGRFRDVPTSVVLRERMTPAQKSRLSKLLADLKALKREVLNPTPIDVVEPRLASPRSSLDPAHFDSSFEGADE